MEGLVKQHLVPAVVALSPAVSHALFGLQFPGSLLCEVATHICNWHVDPDVDDYLYLISGKALDQMLVTAVQRLSTFLKEEHLPS